MSEKASSPDEADNTGNQPPVDRESIVVPAEILTQAGWAPPTAPATADARTEQAPQVFASNQRKVPLSEAGYDQDPGGVGRLGVILGSVVAVLLVASAVTMYYVVNRDGGDKAAAKSDSAKASPSAGASDAPTQAPVPPIKDSAKVMPTVAGDFGTKATITLPKDAPDGTFVVKELSAGTGPKVEKGNWVSVDYTAMDWQTGKEIPGSYGEQNGKPQLYQAGGGSLIPALDNAVEGHKAGSRLVVVAPPAAAFGPQGNSQLGIGAGDSLVFVLDIRQANAPGAVLSGDVTPPPADFPQVKDNGTKPAEITPPKGVADPTELKTHVLIQGKGRKVEAGENVLVQYTGVLYKDGKKFDSSLDRGQAFTFTAGAGKVIEGWDKGITGQAIGSRVELVIPASLGYKDQASDSIPANSTLVFVVDILDAGVGGSDG
ncbi:MULTISPECIES: FKBP-type peptidyl-prolyl cis-trans isomerase [Kitasatospora]|uniref:peptidylprolyl isomerase n=1 Tax=Kitasatospora setae (strain ATCC 33774 / DSM 43861 / JCM 3304 / KCC A-0304 / NBRC 14216 / KM-6054) TaxID=452652 RepID=E4N2P2_KITSK|nr:MULTISPECIES: FKBP-type peptidyl-prolyl cis-trans isomerase [Kitasatospora]BAJ32426.1 putative peptidyl-prolyl cis-trans isomerase FKBP-type [Kitasatospora setae KM-6054]